MLSSKGKEGARASETDPTREDFNGVRKDDLPGRREPEFLRNFDRAHALNSARFCLRRLIVSPEDPREVALLVQTLRRINPRIFIEMINHPDPSERCQGARALGICGNASHRILLFALAQSDPDDIVRQHARLALDQIRRREQCEL